MLTNFLLKANTKTKYTFSITKNPQSSPNVEDQQPILTDLNIYNTNPFLSSNTKMPNNLSTVTTNLKQLDRKFLKHMPNAAPFKQVYKERMRKNIRIRNGRTEWFISGCIALFVISLGKHRIQMW